MNNVYFYFIFSYAYNYVHCEGTTYFCVTDADFPVRIAFTFIIRLSELWEEEEAELDESELEDQMV